LSLKAALRAIVAHSDGDGAATRTILRSDGECLRVLRRSLEG